MTIDIAPHPHLAEVLTDEAVAFLVELERRFGPTRRELLAARRGRQARLDAGELPDFLPETAAVRSRRLVGRRATGGPAGPSRRDHRARSSAR